MTADSVPRSKVAGIVWPPPIDGAGADMLALQFQYSQSERWPPGTRHQWQMAQLREIVAQCEAAIPFWRARFQQAGLSSSSEITPERWHRLPILTRRDVQNAGNALHASPLPTHHGRIGTSRTSGSTGEPVTCLKTEMAMFYTHGAQLRQMLWHRWNPMARVAHIADHRLPDTAPPEGRTLPQGGPPLTHVFACGPVHQLDIRTPIAAQADWLRRRDPDVLVSWPSNLQALAQHCREARIELPRLLLIRTVAEPVTARLRQLCRDVWRAEIVDSYSTEEVGLIALQCPQGPDMHVMAENMLLEIVDEAGLPVEPGQTGRVVVTPLHNFAMPLLRYELGDWAMAGAPCPCGRHLPTISRIAGRARDRLVLPDGTRRFADIPDEAFAALPAILRHQIAQTAPDCVEIRMVTRGRLPAAKESGLREAVGAALGSGFRIELVYRDTLDPPPGRKFRQMLCEIAPAEG